MGTQWPIVPTCILPHPFARMLFSSFSRANSLTYALIPKYTHSYDHESIHLWCFHFLFILLEILNYSEMPPCLMVMCTEVSSFPPGRYSITNAFCIAFVMTFFSAFDVPVFWPILLFYWLSLFILTMRRQIVHMIKYKYVPFSFGKQVTERHLTLSLDQLGLCAYL